MIDNRLSELLDTLYAANLDWLAEEILRATIIGDKPLESEDDVVKARDSVFRSTQNSGGYNPSSDEPVEPRPLEADGQLEWAISHILIRLEDAVNMMTEATENIDFIVTESESSKETREIGSSTDLVLLSHGEIVGEANRIGLNNAKKSVEELRSILEQWLDQNQKGDFE